MPFLFTYSTDMPSIEKEANNDSFSPFLKIVQSQLAETLPATCSCTFYMAPDTDQNGINMICGQIYILPFLASYI